MSGPVPARQGLLPDIVPPHGKGKSTLLEHDGEEELLLQGRSKLYQRRRELERELRREFDLVDESVSVVAQELRSPVIFGRPPPVPRPRLRRAHLPQIPSLGSGCGSSASAPPKRWGLLEAAPDDILEIPRHVVPGGPVVSDEPWWQREQRELKRREEEAARLPEVERLARRSSSPSSRPNAWRTPHEPQPAPLPGGTPSPAAFVVAASEDASRQQRRARRVPSPEPDPEQKAHIEKAKELEEMARALRQQHQQRERRQPKSDEPEETPAEEAARARDAVRRREELNRLDEDRYEKMARDLQRRAEREAEEIRRRREEQQEWEREFRNKLEAEEHKRRLAVEQDRRREEQQREELEAEHRRREAERLRRKRERRRAEAEESHRRMAEKCAEAEREAEAEAERLRQRLREQERAVEAAKRRAAAGEHSPQQRHAPGPSPPPQQPSPPPPYAGFGRCRQPPGGGQPCAPGASLSLYAPLPRVGVSPQVAQAEAAAMARLRQIAQLPDKDSRHKAFKDLLRAWHPDKNPADVEVATAVFQRIQGERSKVLGL
mmetsp:Transcript_121856/g.351798  ORF Transcript_121856/g.351798 Transcript_121856/m.351798 type:complete len:549 (-) Transcript_121856:104-1750(-)|eukprot:CAMPEP_0176053830 /NCGR_PEP_ID=MMETSP0120_2-20121206/26779_1 /TAXON_ID=160619 /ORGANISM="Kryptoperidinium foliaceum, Strain CCMP 1326" /LENGTH=548 /DNA_ID=CAMNT_0017387291 /DNA_START=6 /DNA_END=1652 /DNA_ORIENTATION=+